MLLTVTFVIAVFGAAVLIVWSMIKDVKDCDKNEVVYLKYRRKNNETEKER